MRKSLLHWAAALGIAVAFSSCTYDPYYSSAGGSYGSSGYGGYGDGYGYGSPGFSTSFFVSTGDSRWGYDPYCYSYYDYHRRCYYDPYLSGYYPVGYRPPVIVGCPHPHGWRPGSGYCPPPHGVRNITVVNYRNRESSYRNLNHSWARSVRADYGNHSNRGFQNNRDSFNTRQQAPKYTDSWKKEGFGTTKVPSGDRRATLPGGFNQPVMVPNNRSSQGRFLESSRNSNRNVELGRTRDFNMAPQGGHSSSSNRITGGDRPNFAPSRVEAPPRSDRNSGRESSGDRNESKRERKEGFR